MAKQKNDNSGWIEMDPFGTEVVKGTTVLPGPITLNAFRLNGGTPAEIRFKADQITNTLEPSMLKRVPSLDYLQRLQESAKSK
ncbi:hypothetical protein CO134_00845 [Candidatus Kuenenbacteria bacterium CG_4_9_14_3_um_filter_39_14]|uniref:Uncharacterized protein n=7 Tax=Candidatus Kueneniibacteriota TaxID=1752740 RepID=A0A2M7ILC2_9BACT|nr:MAG: hypothetical protein AUK13_02420 [Candidatus Kuenenbacteria bacterium CG2_30_39_24]PIP28725.1 MAG: hypothetical protein COX28_03230 [Candidatus Kuenenbacteria bacterium CG23_combo_of_CG06-09_8_20_14_all_39_39]PIP75363.1 MAG: hypothetical protein COW86_04220 [Candidatus Kuenenbacteria bacterium CG22_combo_CG10-13_8_21_14_all_39_9]PIR80802.1 MAG: hypothetical protein COU24_01985 [Candidatus Kuenenbacteria bacterium CG10_big_fil_rev_8_21_14_0_10_39_14]PIW95527.1 MAG: hypothetical protein C